MLQAPITNKTVPAVAKVMTYYQSCMNTTLLEEKASHDLANLLRDLGTVYFCVFNAGWRDVALAVVFHIRLVRTSLPNFERPFS